MTFRDEDDIKTLREFIAWYEAKVVAQGHAYNGPDDLDASQFIVDRREGR